MCFITKAMLINSVDEKCHNKKEESSRIGLTGYLCFTSCEQLLQYSSEVTFSSECRARVDQTYLSTLTAHRSRNRSDNRK